ncbi:MAG: type II toxin-antitoxin system RelE/ParE family toxin [Firmicutes bacterium]|uniref:Type II toxin-antitoxin system RelE/ParE family toxin n=1 Tax=Candidatus Gallilactobacillus intestinavium TaxID=2840838 RepID=A0A9D9E7N2_9LACO|nr:type II toxin-antitoxin system RelE/ParE family toxin [Candidatus Gallilactobacillus intestinavium]
MQIYFFQNNKEQSPFLEWINNIKKNNPSIYKKTIYNINLMFKDELPLIKPNVKSMNARCNYKNLYKLRLGKFRLFFIKNKENYILLHAFRKKTQTTPQKEINQAIKELRSNDFILLNKKEFHL